MIEWNPVCLHARIWREGMVPKAYKAHELYVPTFSVLKDTGLFVFPSQQRPFVGRLIKFSGSFLLTCPTQPACVKSLQALRVCGFAGLRVAGVATLRELSC